MESELRRRPIGRRNLLWCAGFLVFLGAIIGRQSARQAEWAAAIQESVVGFAASQWRVVSHVPLSEERHELLLRRVDGSGDPLPLVVYDAVYERNRFDTLEPGSMIAFERLPADDARCAENNSVDCFLLPRTVDAVDRR